MKRVEELEISVCNACGSQVKAFLHNFRHRGNYLRLCTSCVLKHHSGSFCPHCFELYEGFSPPVNPVLCIKCGFSSHSGCVDKDVVFRYTCPTCVNPSHVFFDVGIVSNKKRKDGDGGSVVSGETNGATIDLKLSKVLLAAAHFAAVSMGKAAVTAKVTAEERGKEAASARKKAREAIDRVNYVAKQKELAKVNERVPRVPSPVAVQVPKKKSVGNSAVAAAVAAQKRFQDQVVMAVPDGNGKSGEGKVKPVGPHVSNVVRKIPINGVTAAPPVVNAHNSNGSLKPVMGRQHPQSSVTVVESEESSNLAHLQKNGVQGEKEKKGLLSGTHTTGKAQHPQNSHPPIGDREKFKELSNSQMVPELTNLNEGSADASVSRNNDGVSQGLSKMS